MERIIKVRGVGKISVRPDMISLAISISDVQETYDAAVKMSTAMTELLRIGLLKLEFSKTDLKSVAFSVAPVQDYKKIDAETGKPAISGYRFTHDMKLDFDNDHDRLAKLLHSLSTSPAKPDVKVYYGIKDEEGVKNLLIGKAVADARMKAEVMSQAAGIQLGNIQTMEYGLTSDFELISETNLPLGSDVRENPEAKFRMNIEPVNIEATDTVTLIWSVL